MTDVLEDIRTRVCFEIGHNFTTQEAIAVSLASTATKDREYLFGMLLNNVQAKKATRSSDAMSPSKNEWDIIFGSTALASIMQDGGLADFTQNSAFAEHHLKLEEALRCSLSEEQSRCMWSRPLTKVACYLALHSEDPESKIAACLGGIVRADIRRLDDVRYSIEDGDVDYMLMTRAVLAVAKSIAH